VTLFEKIQDTTAFVKSKIKEHPQIGIILGSGFGGLTDIVNIELEIPYEDIPHFPVSTVEGHAGKLIFGKLGAKQVMMMAGRFHYYEGYNMTDVTFPVRIMKALGVHSLVVSNAAGGMNPRFKIGDIMILTDHINLFPEHPLRGPNDERLGPRFPDMSVPYDAGFIKMAQDIAKEQKLDIHSGVYIGLQGPTFETPAEYKWLHIIGGDAVGMSTVPEVIVARHSGIKCFAVSIITDIGISEVPVKITLEEVLEAANATAPKLAGLVSALIGQM